MEQFDFDGVIDRRGTNCNKWDGAGGADILPFTIADMDFAVPPCVQEALEQRVKHPVYGYTFASAGLNQAVVDWMARRHGVAVDKEWIKPTTGILNGLACAIRAVTRPGDRMMVFTPVYNPFFEIIEGAGCTLVECPLKKENDSYFLDFNAIEEQFRAGMKAILFCNPHNPAGRIWTRAELDRLADLCVKYHVYFLSDEAHADFELFGNKYTPVCTLPQLKDLGISCVSSNKSFNIPALSIAFLIIPNRELYEAVSRSLRGVWITTPPLMSMVAAEAGYRGADKWMDAVLRYIEGNSEFVRDYVARNMPRIRIAKHEGTYLLWLDISCFGMSDEAVAKEMSEEYGVLLTGGSMYRGDGDSHLRFNLGAPRCQLERALDAIVPMYRKHCGS